VTLRIVLIGERSSSGCRRRLTRGNCFGQPPLHDEPRCTTGSPIRDQRGPLAGGGAQLDPVVVAVFILDQNFNGLTCAIVGVVAHEVVKIGEV
jgi:hypothetical protein